MRWPLKGDVAESRMSMPDDTRNDMPRRDMHDDMHHPRGSWMVPLVLLIALAAGGLIYAFTSGDSTTASDRSAPSMSTTGSSTTGTGRSGERTSGGSAASR